MVDQTVVNWNVVAVKPNVILNLTGTLIFMYAMQLYTCFISLFGADMSVCIHEFGSFILIVSFLCHSMLCANEDSSLDNEV